MNRFTILINPLVLMRAFMHSLQGLSYAIKNERAFQQELVVLVVAAVAAFVMSESGIERAVLIGSVAGVLIVELINSAIESVIDRIGLASNAISKRAKDLGSAAVLVSLVAAVAIWIAILVD